MYRIAFGLVLCCAPLALAADKDGKKADSKSGEKKVDLKVGDKAPAFESVDDQD